MGVNHTKRAFVRDPEAFRERVEARARELAENGYSIAETDGVQAGVMSGEQSRYEVDPVHGTCTCWCFRNVGFCKHVLGLNELAKRNYRETIAKAHRAASQENDLDAFEALRSAERLFRWAARVKRERGETAPRRPRRRTRPDDRLQGKLLLDINQVFPPASDLPEAA